MLWETDCISFRMEAMPYSPNLPISPEILQAFSESLLLRQVMDKLQGSCDVHFLKTTQKKGFVIFKISRKMFSGGKCDSWGIEHIQKCTWDVCTSKLHLVLATYRSLKISTHRQDNKAGKRTGPAQGHGACAQQRQDSQVPGQGSLCGSDGKASACNAGDPGSIPEWGRAPGEGNGNPLQYSWLENPMDRGAWWAIVHGVAKS